MTYEITEISLYVEDLVGCTAEVGFQSTCITVSTTLLSKPERQWKAIPGRHVTDIQGDRIYVQIPIEKDRYPIGTRLVVESAELIEGKVIATYAQNTAYIDENLECLSRMYVSQSDRLYHVAKGIDELDDIIESSDDIPVDIRDLLQCRIRRIRARSYLPVIDPED